MNRTSETDIKRWARLVKTNEDVKAIRKIVCHRCQLFKPTADDNSYAHGGCQYYFKTGDARVWSIMSCMDMGSFTPKMNVDVEIVRGKLNEWIRKRSETTLGYLPESYISRSDGGVCRSELQGRTAHHQGETCCDEEGMLEVQE